MPSGVGGRDKYAFHLSPGTLQFLSKTCGMAGAKNKALVECPSTYANSMSSSDLATPASVRSGEVGSWIVHGNDVKTQTKLR